METLQGLDYNLKRVDKIRLHHRTGFFYFSRMFLRANEEYLNECSEENLLELLGAKAGLNENKGSFREC